MEPPGLAHVIWLSLSTYQNRLHYYFTLLLEGCDAPHVTQWLPQFLFRSMFPPSKIQAVTPSTRIVYNTRIMQHNYCSHQRPPPIKAFHPAVVSFRQRLERARLYNRAQCPIGAQAPCPPSPRQLIPSCQESLPTVPPVQHPAHLNGKPRESQCSAK